MNDEQILEIAEEQSSDALTPEHRAFCINFARALLSASESAEPVALPSLKPRLLNQLRRFNECCQDSQAGGHDVDKEDMQSLAEFGAVRPAPGGRHYLTDFGAYVLACAAPRPIEAPDMLARAVANAEHEQSLDAYIEAPAQAVALSEQDLADVRDAAKILAYEDSVKGALGMRLTSLAHRLATANKPVDDSRERFWRELRAIHDPDDLNKHEIELAWSLWQAAERQAFERAIKAIETVRAPICDPARPIRELIEQSASKEKQG